MKRRMMAFFNKYDILYKYQFGFRSSHSTSLALTELTDTIYQWLDQDYYVLALHFDVEKALQQIE